MSMLDFLRDTQHKINEVVILAVERNLNIVISLKKDNLETIVDDQIQQINPLNVWYGKALRYRVCQSALHFRG